MQVHRCATKIDVDHLAATKATQSSYDIVLGGNESCDVLKPDGSVLIKYRPNWFGPDLCDSIWPLCRRVAKVSFNRGTAAGRLGEAKNRDEREIAQRTNTRYRPVKADGTVSKTNYAAGVESGVVGYFDRSARFPFCRQTSFLISEAAAWRKFLPYIERADSGFREFMPDRWEAQRGYVDRTASDWIIPQSVFTTVTVNKNFQTAIHKDAGDLRAGFGVMSCLRNKRYQGAYLVFPAYRVAVDFAHGSLCLADVHEWHSNTAFQNMSLGYERITLVFYYRENMIHCKPTREETEWAKNRRPGEKLR